MSATLTVHRGSSNSWLLTWRNQATQAATDLTNYTVDVYDAAATIAPYLAHAIADAVNGQTTLTLTWHEKLSERRSYPFRLRIQPGAGGAQTTEEILLEVK